MTLGQGTFGEEVGVDGVFNVDHVHPVSAGADDAQPPGLGAREDAGHQVRIADAPDQMRPERKGAQRGRVGRQHLPLRDGLGQRIRARAIGRERERLVGPGEIPAVVNYAGRARVDEPGNAVLPASVQQGTGAENVGPEEILVTAPDPHLGGDMKDGFNSRARGGDRRHVVKRRADKANPTTFEIGRGVAAEDGHATPVGEEALDKAAAEKTGAAGDEDVGG